MTDLTLKVLFRSNVHRISNTIPYLTGEDVNIILDGSKDDWIIAGISPHDEQAFDLYITDDSSNLYIASDWRIATPYFYSGGASYFFRVLLDTDNDLTNHFYGFEFDAYIYVYVEAKGTISVRGRMYPWNPDIEWIDFNHPIPIETAFKDILEIAIPFSNLEIEAGQPIHIRVDPTYIYINDRTPTASLTLTINAEIDIDPDTLNLNEKGKWITCYIELPEGYSVADIDTSTILLDDTIPAEPHPIEIGDHDNDGTPDLMIKFNRTTVAKYISEILQITNGEVTLKITGKTAGTPFKGFDTIRVISKGKH